MDFDDFYMLVVVFVLFFFLGGESIISGDSFEAILNIHLYLGSMLKSQAGAPTDFLHPPSHLTMIGGVRKSDRG